MVRVISMKLLRDFWERHGDAERPLRHWFKITRRAHWRNLRDVRRTFPHADGVRTSDEQTLTVFDIGGNRYRLIVRIRYDHELVNVRAVLTHAEYGRGEWRE